LGIKERRAALTEIYESNIRTLRKAVEFCLRNEFGLYRISASLFPFADTPFGFHILKNCAAELRQIGRRALDARLRLVNHPDQYVVLNSESPAVVHNSLTILDAQAAVFDLLEQPRSPWAAIEIHGGKSGRGPSLIHTVRQLDEPIRARLVLENDERAFGAADMLAICQEAGVPMVFDAHHHVVHERLSSYEHPSVAYYLNAAQKTWPDPAWQLVHISNGRDSFLDPAHSDMITVMPSAYRNAPYIEVEAKGKERAIRRLKRSWAGGEVKRGNSLSHGKKADPGQRLPAYRSRLRAARRMG
jgi:UV DNA damage endonuclease